MFKQFAQLVHGQFNALATQSTLFEVDIDLWPHYLAAYPEGTNEIFKTNTEHDCSCCRHFVRNIGNVVAIVNGTLCTVWDHAALQAPEHYGQVANRLRDLVLQAPIKSVYGASDRFHNFGQATNYDPVNDRNWDHFHAVVPRSHWRNPTQIGDINTTYQVLKRGLEEIDILHNLQEVINLAEDNQIYRGAEHLPTLHAFAQLVREYQASNDKNLFLWANLNHRSARFRNTVIGSLVVDLCEGVDLDHAVRSFEAKVAPENYKRPKSLITPKMIDDALKTLDDLNLRSALDRRMARFSDLSVTDVLFVDNDAAPLFRDGLKDLLLTQTKPKAPDTSKAIPITIDELLKLKPTSLAILVENRHAGNFVTLTAPKDPSCRSPFRWDNGFAWSYDGNVTDSIRERVKKAGGNVDNAAMRISLSWFNRDDLDLHVIEPNGNQVCFHNKCGKLDVDMNNGFGTVVRDAVENVSYRSDQILDGTYKVVVDNYNRREAVDVGFDLEIVVNGETHQFSYEQPVGRQTPTITFKIEHRSQLTDLKTHTGVKTTNRSQTKWGVSTLAFHKVQTLTISPNHWADTKPTGNKHWFFILEGCKNPDSVRGIYNEFLSPAFEANRKVFEILGDKTKAEPTPDQLSGLGFSSTLGEEVFVQVNGAQTYKVSMK